MTHAKSWESSEEEARIQQAITAYKKKQENAETAPLQGNSTCPQGLSGQLIEAEKGTKERKTSGAKKDKSREEKALEDFSNELEASQDESLVVVDCIVVQW